MKLKFGFALILAITALAAAFSYYHQPSNHPTPTSLTDTNAVVESAAPSAEPMTVAPKTAAPKVIVKPNIAALPTVAEKIASMTNKLERLESIREGFKALAAGDAATALRAAKEIKDASERETALMTLVTEWRGGNLGSPMQRAENISRYGLEAGLGLELADNPALALAWADQLTGGAGRAAIYKQVAIGMASSDPDGAFALAEQLPEADRPAFYHTVFANWAAKDTEGALQFANSLAPDQRDWAVGAIRTAAPVGIGAILTSQDGYPVIKQLVPGAPAELSGQLHAGDRIIAVSGADNSFVDAHGLSLNDAVQLIHGPVGSSIQLQVLAADAPPDSAPRVVSILRDQVKFKN